MNSLSSGDFPACFHPFMKMLSILIECDTNMWAFLIKINKFAVVHFILGKNYDNIGGLQNNLNILFFHFIHFFFNFLRQMKRRETE